MKRKGFTTIELIVALAITSIVMGIILPFYLSNETNLNAVEVRSELQMEAQVTMETLSKSAMEARSIERAIKIDGTSLSGEFGAQKIKEIDLKTDTTTHCEFFFNADIRELSYTSNKPTAIAVEKVIGRDIDSVTISPKYNINGAGDKVCLGIVVALKMSKKNIEYDMENTIYFRNSP